jgi:hypothetical protein
MKAWTMSRSLPSVVAGRIGSPARERRWRDLHRRRRCVHSNGSCSTPLADNDDEMSLYLQARVADGASEGVLNLGVLAENQPLNTLSAAVAARTPSGSRTRTSTPTSRR